MKIRVDRYKDNSQATIGKLYIDGTFQCYTVEDEKRETKVSNETRVPEGTYDVNLRKEGSFHTSYTSKFPDMHIGMLGIHNEPNWKLVNAGMTFQYILIHIGNTEKDTAGCLLLNDSINESALTGGGSTNAYKRVYPIIANALSNNEKVTIEYNDVSGSSATASSASSSSASSSNGNEISMPSRGYFKKGDNSAEVLKIQTALKNQDFWGDTAFNTNFGSATDAAVRKYQTAKGLTADGLAGKSTISKLGLTIK